MHNKILIMLTPLFLIVFCAILTTSTAIAQQTDSASVSRQTQPAKNGDDCTIVNQRLDKTLDALEKSEAEKAAQVVTIDALLKLDAVNNALIGAKDSLLKSKDAELEVFRKLKCSKTSFLFGLISKKTCF